MAKKSKSKSIKPNFASNTIWTGDNLPIMRGINSESIDLIYLDPPFNSNRSYEAPIGSKAAGASFKDAWTLDDIDVCEHGELADRNPAAYAVIEAARQAHGKGMQSYLIFMAVRLLEIKRLVKPTGSIYLHCDTTANSYLRILMDGVFGKDNFQNEIIWRYKYGGRSKKHFGNKHDIILFYRKTKASPFYVDSVRIPYEPESLELNFRHTDENGRRYRQGKWKSGKVYRYYADEGRIPDDVWNDINSIHAASKERTGYPTQKPLALLERIIKASSNEGDMVFDPFCGCATTLVAADKLERKWAGIDLSPLAVDLVNERIKLDRGPWVDTIVPDKPPVRTDLGKLPNYQTHRHRLYGEQEGICVGCKTHFPFQVMDVDHILPRSRGGTDHIDNLQLLCSGCNRSKGRKTMAEWKAAR